MDGVHELGKRTGKIIKRWLLLWGVGWHVKGGMPRNKGVGRDPKIQCTHQSACDIPVNKWGTHKFGEVTTRARKKKTWYADPILSAL